MLVVIIDKTHALRGLLWAILSSSTDYCDILILVGGVALDLGNAADVFGGAARGPENARTVRESASRFRSTAPSATRAAIPALPLAS